MKGKSGQHSYCIQPGTQGQTQAKMQRRKRPLPDVTSSDRLNQRFMDILWGIDPDVTIYIYRATEDGYVIRPMLAKWGPLRDLETHIRDAFGPGRYAVYMRKGETMLLACSLAIDVPMSWSPPEINRASKK